jgi:hypothetical protein
MKDQYNGNGFLRRFFPMACGVPGVTAINGTLAARDGDEIFYALNDFFYDRLFMAASLLPSAAALAEVAGGECRTLGICRAPERNRHGFAYKGPCGEASGDAAEELRGAVSKPLSPDEAWRRPGGWGRAISWRLSRRPQQDACDCKGFGDGH